jgi:mRNA interferase HigB
MRIISKARIKDFWAGHREAEAALKQWYKIVTKEAKWTCFADVRKTFNTADTYSKDDKTYTIFNAGGNKYRIITAINYKIQIVFIGMVLTHAEYSKNKWKDLL